jgi:AcrR family transcriptional regulator
MPLLITKKEKLQLRELHILACARKIISSQGLIGLKMPSLAKEADISIGSLYRHFESREDLISAVAEYSLRTRVSKLRLVFDLFDDPKDCVIATPLIDFLFNVFHSEAFHTETCCTNASFIAQASQARQRSYAEQGSKISSLLIEILSQAHPKNNLPETTLGIWCLVSGMSLIWYSEAREPLLNDALNFFRPHLTAFLNGHLPQLAIKPDQIKNVETILIENQKSWIWLMNGEKND